MASRAYVVGLPVVITVDNDGKITVDVDLSEAGDGIADMDDQHDPKQQERDATWVDYLYARGGPFEVKWFWTLEDREKAQ